MTGGAAGLPAMWYGGRSMKAMKTLFLWLLMAFVPLQGMAANALLVCKAANQAQAVFHAMPAGEEHAHPCAGMQALQEELRDTQQQDTQQDGDATCVAQYAGVPWIPASELALPPMEVPPAAISYAGFRIPSFIPEGLERPPRSLSL